MIMKLKLLKLIIIVTITVLSANNLLSQSPPTVQSDNTFKMSIYCHPPIFYSNDLPNVLSPSVVCGEDWTDFNGDNNANIIEFNFWGDGTKTYNVEITTATNQYPPSGSGPFAYITTEWTYIDRNHTSDNWIAAEQGNKFEQISPSEDHCDGHFVIKLKAVKGRADADFYKVDQVPFTFKLSVTD